MKQIKSTLLILLWLLCPINPVLADVEDEMLGLLEVVSQSREAWSQLKPAAERPSQENMRIAIKRLDGLANNNKDRGHSVVRYLKLRAALISDQPDVAKNLVSVDTTSAMVFENTVAVTELIVPQKHSDFVSIREKLMPMDTWGIQYPESDLYNILGHIKRIPEVRDGQLEEVARCIEMAGLPDLAWRAYSESNYKRYAPCSARAFFPNTWLSDAAAPGWMKVAQLAYEAGKIDLAWEYLIKSSVFGTPEQSKLANETAKRWLTAERVPNQPTTQSADAKIRREALAKVIQLYCDMNAHPRALELIDAFPDAFDNPQTLRADVALQWKTAVRSISALSKRFVIYGVEVFPKDNLKDVRIPWALSDEAINSLSKFIEKVRLGELDAPKETQSRP